MIEPVFIPPRCQAIGHHRRQRNDAIGDTLDLNVRVAPQEDAPNDRLPERHGRHVAVRLVDAAVHRVDGRERGCRGR